MSQLTEFDKGRILALYQDGYAIRAISRALGFSKSTVHLWVKRMAKEGHVTCRRRSGRPRITTEDQDKSIRRCVDEDPYRTRKEIKNMLHLSVSKETIRRRLIEQGGTQKNETPLQFANQSQLTDAVESLCSVDMSLPDTSRNCPFQSPPATGQDDITPVLVGNGADTDSLSERPKDSYQTLHHSSIDDNNESVSEFLVQSGGDSNASRQLGPGGGGGEGAQKEQPPLHTWGVENVVQALSENGAAINAKVDDRDAHQRTALHVAAGAGHAAVISALLQNGADANAVDSEGDNALHIACREGQRGSALVLLTESQLDAEAVNLKGRNPLHELAGASKDTAAGIAEMFIECIPHYPLDKPDVDGNTALLLAYMEGNGNLCHTLVRFGASLCTMNKDGVTIFDSQGSTKELLRSLLDNLSREPHFTEGDICLECGIKFGGSVHKHHCNHCGRILCSKCSDRAVPILKFGLNKPVRVCTVCFSVLQGPG
ncbi:rabankyrin-5-like isoform X5 [Schistocerca cancellata]|uniref:rabankyrin-5-like isoform X5 n=1 Tax=Schistocerca cancellata TaxID=274614 RepID=UPI0021173C7F|nr:rabankyrin-5-like isoform X5 [Schistocerca cancellata]